MDQHAAFLYASYARLRSSGATCSLLHTTQGGVSRSTLTLDHGPLRPPSAGPPVPPVLPQPLSPHPHLVPQHPLPQREEGHRRPKHRGPATRARDKARRSAWLAARQAPPPPPQLPSQQASDLQAPLPTTSASDLQVPATTFSTSLSTSLPSLQGSSCRDKPDYYWSSRSPSRSSPCTLPPLPPPLPPCTPPPPPACSSSPSNPTLNKQWSGSHACVNDPRPVV